MRTPIEHRESDLSADDPDDPQDPPASIDDDDDAGTSDEPEFRTVVETQPSTGLEAQRDLDRQTPGFGTSVDLRDPSGARPDDALGEVVARTPGAHVRSAGGLGQFSAVSLRGSSAQQVGIFTDGIPLGDSFGGLVNLSDIPLDGLSRIDIYRGHVPAVFGGATLGGAINLISTPRWGRRSAGIRAGYGSFGSRQVGTYLSVPLRPNLQFTTRLSYAGAQGDFQYYDDASTPLVTADDRTLTRRNNDYDRVLGQVRVDAERGPVRYSVQQGYVGRWSGIAGPVGAPSGASTLGTQGLRTTGSVQHTAFGRPGGRIGAWFGLGLRRQRFEDPRGELGPGANDQRLDSLDVYASPRWRTPLWKGAFVGLSADVRPEWIDVRESVGSGLASGDATRSRIRTGVGVELEQFLFDRRVRIVPIVRVDALHSRFAVAAGQGEIDDEGEDVFELGTSPRIGTRIRLVGPLELRGSVGRYFRAPTLLELFGDRGYAVGNEGLRSERGTNVDGGLVLDHQGSGLELYGQLAGFASWSEDLIAWIAAGRITRAVNLAAARVRGMEASVHLLPASRRISLDAHYTFTDAVDRGPDPTFRDQPLPGRPRHDAFVRATVGFTTTIRGVAIEPRLLSTAEFIAGTRLDPSGRFEIPPRFLQGLGGELHVARRVHWALEVRNLLDVRTAAVTFPVGQRRPTPVPLSDFIGFPLPGRSVWTTLTIDLQQPEDDSP